MVSQGLSGSGDEVEAVLGTPSDQSEEEAEQSQKNRLEANSESDLGSESDGESEANNDQTNLNDIDQLESTSEDDGQSDDEDDMNSGRNIEDDEAFVLQLLSGKK